MTTDAQRDAIARAFTDAVHTYLPEEDAAAVLSEALAAGGLKQVPTEPATIRAFTMGPLWRVLVDNRGARRFALEAGKLARTITALASAQPAAPAAPTRYALAVTLDANIFERLKAAAPPEIELRRADRLLDLAPLSALRKDASSTLLVHVDTSAVSLTTLARMTPVLSQQCRVLVAGVSERALAQLIKMYPMVERWERKATLEEAAAAL